MAINTSTFESTLQTKLDAVSDAKEMLLLGKALESTVGSIAVSDITTEGNTKVAAVNAEGTTQVSAVNSAGTTQVAAVNSIATSTFKTVGGENILGTGDIDAYTPILHKYRIVDIPSTGVGSNYFSYTFTVTQDCTILINAQATVRQNVNTHDYCYMYLNASAIAEASVSDRTYNWATNHAFAGVWATVSAGSHTISLQNNGGGSAYGANNINYDGYVTIQEIA